VRSALPTVLAVILATPIVRAQPAEPPAQPAPSPAPARPAKPKPPKPWEKGVTAAQRATANRCYKQGNQLFGKGQYAKALGHYRRAARSWQHPSIQFNMAVCYIELDRPLDALATLRKALRFGQGPLTDELYVQAKRYLKLLKGRLAFVKVSCKEPDAQVTLDGKVLFTGPGTAERVVVPGLHQVVASKQGFVTLSKTLSLFSGKKTEVELKLVRLETVVEHKRRWRRWMPWTVFGAGAAIALTGLPLILKARSDYNKYDRIIADECDRGCATGDIPSDAKRAKKSGDAAYYSSITMFALGAATLAGGIVLIVLNQPRKVEREDVPSSKPAGLTFLPVFWPNGGMLTTGFSF
jgi:hypothetical protein